MLNGRGASEALETCATLDVAGYVGRGFRNRRRWEVTKAGRSGSVVYLDSNEAATVAVVEVQCWGEVAVQTAVDSLSSTTKSSSSLILVSISVLPEHSLLLETFVASIVLKPSFSNKVKEPA